MTQDKGKRFLNGSLKPLRLGMDGIWVGWGMEHLTMLIINNLQFKLLFDPGIPGIQSTSPDVRYWLCWDLGKGSKTPIMEFFVRQVPLGLHRPDFPKKLTEKSLHVDKIWKHFQRHNGPGLLSLKLGPRPKALETKNNQKGCRSWSSFMQWTQRRPLILRQRVNRIE